MSKKDKVLTVEFYECEHEGDLDIYASDVQASGGKILDRRIDYDDEIGRLKFRVTDKKDFITQFKNTDSYSFLN